MAAKRIDFDAYRSEHKRAPIEFVIGGETYELTPGLPATLMLDVLGLDPDDPVPDNVIHDLLAHAFGSVTSAVEMMRKHGLAVDEFEPLFRMLLDAYRGAGEAEPEGAEGNAGARPEAPGEST